MKKIITVCLLALMIIPMVSAADVNKVDPEKSYALEVVSEYNMPLTARAKAMGGAGIAFPGRADAFFLNPAGLAKRGTVLLPSAEVTLYHPYDMLNPGESGKSLVDSLIEAQNSGDPNALTDAIEPLLGMIKSGRGKILDVNARVAFDFAGFAIGVNVDDSVHTFATGMGGIDSTLFDELNVTANVGLGLRFKIGDSFWIDAGANFRPTFKAYSAAIGATDILDVVQPPSDPNGTPVDPATFFLEKLPVAAGVAYPFDVGINFGNSWFSVGLVGRNILGSYNMKAYDNINSFYPNWTTAFKGGDFKISTPWTLDFGLGFKWDNAFFKPTFVADFVDIIGCFTDENFTARSLMEHVKLGAEIRLLSFLDIRGGLNQGYWSVGAGLDLAIIKVDVAYYWQEFGEKLGDYGLDAVSVRINVGFDR